MTIADSLARLTSSIEATNSAWDWGSVITSVTSIISMVAIIVLILDRIERKRPYLQVSFELVRSVLACISIKNVGQVPARLSSLRIDNEFLSQLPDEVKSRIYSKNIANVLIYPGKQWIISLDIATFDLLKFPITKTNIDIEYSKLNQHKAKYKENTYINFSEYSGFLVYISEIDELTNQIKDITKELEKIEMQIISNGSRSPTKASVVYYSNTEDEWQKCQIVHDD